jgi:phosphate/sulfate permease
MVMLESLLLLVIMVLVGVADYQAIGVSESLPNAGLQIGIFAFLIGIAVTRAIVDALKRTYDDLDDRPARKTGGTRRVVTTALLIAAALLAAAYGASLYAAALGFLLGCLCHATPRVRDISERIRGLQARARKSTDAARIE